MQLTNTQQALSDGLEQLVRVMRTELQATNANATGSTSRSLKSEIVTSRQNFIRGQITGLETWRFTDQGRGAGGMPPVQKLVQWVAVKLGLSGNEGRQVAWAIAKKIAREGTRKPPSEFATTAIKLQTPVLRQAVARGLREDIRLSVRQNR